MRDLSQVLGACRYSAAIVAVGGGAFLVVPQGQDVLRRVVEWGHESFRALPPGAAFSAASVESPAVVSARSASCVTA